MPRLFNSCPLRLQSLALLLANDDAEYDSEERRICISPENFPLRKRCRRRSPSFSSLSSPPLTSFAGCVTSLDCHAALSSKEVWGWLIVKKPNRMRRKREESGQKRGCLGEEGEQRRRPIHRSRMLSAVTLQNLQHQFISNRLHATCGNGQQSCCNAGSTSISIHNFTQLSIHLYIKKKSAPYMRVPAS